jgi:hypothetical protein
MSKLVQIQCDMNCYDLQFIRFSNMSEHVQTCSNMSKLVQIQYDTNCYDSYDSQMSEHVQTCLNLFRFNMIQIVTIHMILKHV